MTAHCNQPPHFRGDRQPEVLGKGLFQSEVCENDSPLHVTAKYLISAHAWGKREAIRKPLAWRRAWEGCRELIFWGKKYQFALQDKNGDLN